MNAVSIIEGDITAQEVDVIVNAANSELMHGGGVAAAISRAGGPIVDEQSRAWVRAIDAVRGRALAHHRRGHPDALVSEWMAADGVAFRETGCSDPTRICDPLPD